MADPHLFPLRYAVHGGAPRVDLDLTITADAAVVVDVLTESSLPQRPPTRLGRFSGTVPAPVLDDLAAWAQNARRLPESQAGPSGVVRMLGTGTDPLLPVAPDDHLAAIEQTLAAAAAAALATPTAAVEVGVDTGAGTERLAIRGLGSQPFRLLLFARDIPGYWARVWRDDSAAEGGRVTLRFEELEALIDRGDAPEGVIDLRPDATVTLPLPPGTGTTGGFTFWRAGAGAERRIVAGTWALPS